MSTKTTACIFKDTNPIKIIQSNIGNSFSGPYIFPEIEPRKNKVESILKIRDNLVTYSFNKLLEKSIYKLRSKLVNLKRKKKYTTKPRFINELQDVESSEKKVGNIGVIAPFLEEKQIETGTNYRIRKLTTKVQEIVIREINEQIELPPEPVIINVFITNSLLKAFEGASNLEDYYSTIKYIFLVIDAIQNILNTNITIKVNGIGGDSINIKRLLKNIGINNLESNLEGCFLKSDISNKLNGIIIDTQGIKNYLPIKSNDFLGYDNQFNKDYLDISESISRNEPKLIDMLLKILDNYFE